MSVGLLTGSVFVEMRFWALIFMTVVVPLALYLLLRHRRAVSRVTVLMLGLALVAIAAVDVWLLHGLQNAAVHNASKLDDFLDSEVTVGLYLIPALFGGVGIDLVSTIIRQHLLHMERRHRQHRRNGQEH
ncbi:MAG TPA: hypothetical protein VES41_14085 [Variovorax sp.]|nr:hypothetical protein [Variovorax sp.]